MAEIDLDALAALAKAATPGPWQAEDDAIYPVTPKEDYTGICYDVLREDDAPYIAAVSPDVVLALIARIRTLEERDEAEMEAAYQRLIGN